MGYCSRTDIENVISQALTTANPEQGLTGVPADLTSIGRRFKTRLVTTDTSDYYIRLADSHINAALSQQYVIPLHEICDHETRLVEDINEYTDDLVVYEIGDVWVGQKLVIVDPDNEEQVVVESVTGNAITPVTPCVNLYDASDTRILRIQFPHPIPFISARLAASAIYDKYATAQSEPGKTEFGKWLRQQAMEELDNIREGRTILDGIERIGWRFANPNLVDRYTVKGAVEQDGTRASQQGKS